MVYICIYYIYIYTYVLCICPFFSYVCPFLHLEESVNVCFCFFTSNNVLLAQSDELIIRMSGETTPSDASASLYPLTIMNEPIEIRVHGKYYQVIWL